MEIAMSTEVETQIQAHLGQELSKLSEDQKLSLVLFPETHTNEVTIAGIKITLRPLPIKYTKMIFSALDPHTTGFKSLFVKPDKPPAATVDKPDLNNEAIVALQKAGCLLADYYELPELKTKIQDEDVSLSDLENVLNEQQFINGTNDFLLSPLRLILTFLRLLEVTQVNSMKNLLDLTSSMLHSVKNGAARSTL